MPRRSEVRLTKKIVDAAEYDSKKVGKGRGKTLHVIWDSVISGFGVRIYPSGKKSWLIKYRAAGRQRTMTLGNYPPMTLDEARRKAREKLVLVENGVDPLEVKQSEGMVPTFKEFSKTYIERHAKVHKRSWDEDQRRLDQHLFPVIGSRRIDTITRAHIADIHNKLGKRAPYEANRVKALVGVMFERAIEWGVLPENSPNPARRIKNHEEQKRDRFVSETELPRLVKAIDAEPNPHIKVAIWCYLLFGTRKMELLKIKWSYVDMEEGEIRIPESVTKQKRVVYIPLSDAAKMILSGIPRYEGNPYVFPGKRKGRHLVNIDKSWRRIRKEAGLADVRLHDLRRTVGSWLAKDGVPLLTIGRALDHSQLRTTMRYARLTEDPVREALQKHSEHVMEVIGGAKNEAEVIPMKGRAE